MNPKPKKLGEKTTYFRFISRASGIGTPISFFGSRSFQFFLHLPVSFQTEYQSIGFLNISITFFCWNGTRIVSKYQSFKKSIIDIGYQNKYCVMKVLLLV
jgi:hypothetical protein